MSDNDNLYPTIQLTRMAIPLNGKILSTYEYELWRVFSALAEGCNENIGQKVPIGEFYNLNGVYATVLIADNPFSLIQALLTQLENDEETKYHLPDFLALLFSPSMIDLSTDEAEQNKDDTANTEDTEHPTNSEVLTASDDETEPSMLPTDNSVMDSSNPSEEPVSGDANPLPKKRSNRKDTNG